MKKIFLKILQIIAICYLLMDTSVFAQTGQKGADYPAITNKHIAVIVIDFPDTPQPIKDNYFPSIAALRDTIFNGSIKKYLTDMSYGQFTLTGDVFGYFTHQNPGFVNGQITKMTDILTINTINIPGFDINKYDGFAIVPINDVAVESAIYFGGELLINGNSVHTDNIIYVPIRIGYWDRDPIKNPDLNNTMKGSLGYVIPIGDNKSVDDGNDGTNGTTKINYSEFNYTFSHELGHLLGLIHANSRTNSSSYNYEPEVLNNNCLCYGTGSQLGSLLSREYGNWYDLMGTGQYGKSLNMAFRDYLGWTNSSNRYSIKDYGHFSTIIYPINNASGVRTVEIRIPFQYNETNKKNKGYFLEVKSGNYRWDRMLLHPQLQGNNDGIMVMKTDGFNSELLDMSPSPNISIFNIIYPDIRDVVIKPGMVYNNGEIKLSNVTKNVDGSFTIDIDVFIPATITAGGPTTFCQGNNVILTASIANSYLWSNGATTQSITVSTQGNYSVSVDYGTGNNFTSNIIPIIVNPLPTSAGIISGAITVCQGQSSVNYSVPAITNATSYIWTLPTGATGTSTTNSITVSYGTSAVSGSITVKGANTCGNGATSTYAVTVNSIPPTPVITAGGAITFCQGGNVTLTSNAASGNQWYKDGIAISSSTGTAINVNASGSYTVKVTVNSCESAASNTISVIVNSTPAQPGTISGANAICQNTSQTYSVTTVPGAASYTWTLPSGWTGTSTTNSITTTVGTSGGTISVVANNNCGSSNNQTLNVALNPVPFITLIRDTILLSSIASNYRWFFNNNTLNGETSNSIRVKKTGFYRVETSPDKICWAPSIDFPILVLPDRLVNDTLSMDIYPNPTPDNFNVVVRLQKVTNIIAYVTVTNVSGSVVLQTDKLILFSNEVKIPINLNMKGSFFVKVYINGDIKTMGVIIQ